MDSFEINKIIAAVLLIALLVIGIGKISDIAFHVDKPEKSAYKVDIQESTQVSSSSAKKIEGYHGKDQPLRPASYSGMREDRL